MISISTLKKGGRPSVMQNVETDSNLASTFSSEASTSKLHHVVEDALNSKRYEENGHWIL